MPAVGYTMTTVTSLYTPLQVLPKKLLLTVFLETIEPTPADSTADSVDDSRVSCSLDNLISD